MLNYGLRLTSAAALFGGELLVESGRVVAGDGAFEVRPRQFRRLLNTFEGSIQGRILEILGEDEDDRVETLARLLRGTSAEEMTELARLFQTVLQRLTTEPTKGMHRDVS